MRRFDVCNGDADGLCAVRQWRLHDPAEATLITGLKRDIGLLARVDASAGDEVLVCDISMARNRPALVRLLECGAHVRYFDHHAPGAAVSHPGFEAHIDTAADVCTSVLVDRELNGRYRAWAVVGAFGDNLGGVAERLAAAADLHGEQIDSLRMIGEAINYNAYGDDEADVLIAPGRLYALMSRYQDPLEMLACEPVLRAIDARRHDDLAHAADMKAHWQDARGSVLLLPAESWSRRVVGSLANQLAQGQPRCAHALLLPIHGGWRVSVRAPLDAPGGAGALCSRFGGAGRAAAGGIDHLPAAELERFIRAFGAARWDDCA